MPSESGNVFGVVVVGGRWGESSQVLLGRFQCCCSFDRIGQSPLGMPCKAPVVDHKIVREAVACAAV